MTSLLKIDCADKTNHHADKLNPGVMPAFPSNIIAAGRKNSGKGSTIKQLLMSAVPAFDSIYVVHYDPEGTDEWGDVEPAKMYSIEDLPEQPGEFLDRAKKNALVLDELAFEGMTRKQRGKVDRIFNYYGSHYACSCFCIQQNLVSIPPSIRRAADWTIIWPGVDKESMRYIGRITGHDVSKLAKLCKTKYDSLTFDHSGDGPAVRLNLFHEIVTKA